MSTGGAGAATEFGWSVATSCDGRYVLIGSANDPSAVYLYRAAYNDRDTAATNDTVAPSPSPTLYRTFHNPQKDKIRMSQYGVSVTMNVNGQRILIGDPGLDRAYLYDDRGHLLHTFKPTDDDGSELDAMFGGSLSINDDGTVVVIGAQDAYYDGGPFDTEIGAAGAVYVYEFADGRQKWDHLSNSPLYKPVVDFDPTGPQTNDNFGTSVKVSSDGKTLLVGAINVNNQQGAVYLYQITNGNTTTTTSSSSSGGGTTTKMDSNNNNENINIPRSTVSAVEYAHTFVSPQIHNHASQQRTKWFGWAVDMTDRYVYIGSAGDSIDRIDNAGAVFVFSLTERNLYRYVTTILPPVPTADARFGAAISVTGNRMLIASYGDGTAYWYDRASSATTSEDEDAHSGDNTNNNNDRFYASLKQKIPVPTIIATTGSSRFFGASVALSRNGQVGIIGVPRALGKSGYMTTGTAFGLCLPPPPEQLDGIHDGDWPYTNYSCPTLDLPLVSWTSPAFWFSWDSTSGKVVALVGTVALCLCIVFGGKKRHDQRPDRRHRTHRFELLSTSPSDEYDIELRVIQEETGIL
jgi:hypothetical protein